MKLDRQNRMMADHNLISVLAKVIWEIWLKFNPNLIFVVQADYVPNSILEEKVAVCSNLIGVDGISYVDDLSFPNRVVGIFTPIDDPVQKHQLMTNITLNQQYVVLCLTGL